MPQKGYISEYMNGGRIVSHGKITDLSGGFRLGGQLFTLYPRPKEGQEATDVTLSVRCYQDEGFSEAPFACNDWSPLAVAEIAPDASGLLDTCDLYWGSGSYVKP